MFQICTVDKEALQENHMFSRPKWIAVASGKGGVGKSTVTVNLAASFALQGFQVGILDADIYGPSIPKMLRAQKWIETTESVFQWIPAYAHGIHFVSMGFFVAEGEAALIRAPLAVGMVRQFFHKVDWSGCDYVFVDFPPGTGDIHLTLLQEIPFSGALAVTTPQEVALLDVEKAMRMFEQMEVPILGVVENMSYFEDDHGNRRAIFAGCSNNKEKSGVEMLCARYGAALLMQIPLNPRLCEMGDLGVPWVLENPSSSPFEEGVKKILHELEILADFVPFDLVWPKI